MRTIEQKAEAYAQKQALLRHCPGTGKTYAKVLGELEELGDSWLRQEIIFTYWGIKQAYLKGAKA
jgi:hypothetical protein